MQELPFSGSGRGQAATCPPAPAAGVREANALSGLRLGHTAQRHNAGRPNCKVPFQGNRTPAVPRAATRDLTGWRRKGEVDRSLPKQKQRPGGSPYRACPTRYRRAPPPQIRLPYTHTLNPLESALSGHALQQTRSADERCRLPTATRRERSGCVQPERAGIDRSIYKPQGRLEHACSGIRAIQDFPSQPGPDKDPHGFPRPANGVVSG